MTVIDNEKFTGIYCTEDLFADEEALKLSPFFADLDPTIPPNPIGFMIPRPHRPPADPTLRRATIEGLKRSTDLP